MTVVLDTNVVVQMFGARSPLEALKATLVTGRMEVAEDGHFDALRGTGHKPQPITPAEFIARLSTL